MMNTTMIFNSNTIKGRAWPRIRALLLISIICITLTSCTLFGEGQKAPSSPSLPSPSSEPAPTTVRITFPEGMTAREIAQRLEENNVCTAQAFMDEIAMRSFDYPFIQSIPDDERIYLSLEGFLFPDTYEFYFNETPASVIKRFLANFQKRMSDMLPEQMANPGAELFENITLASIIQKEAGDPVEMKLVSSVFWNRLLSPDFPMLQSDVTIFYVNQNITPFVTEEKNTAYAEAYNTYKCKNLPAGPICNPGLEAIKAAFYPEQTDYYYFLTDHAGKYYYTDSFAVHQENWEIAKAVNAKLQDEASSDAQ